MRRRVAGIEANRQFPADLNGRLRAAPVTQRATLDDQVLEIDPGQRRAGLLGEACGQIFASGSRPRYSKGSTASVTREAAAPPFSRDHATKPVTRATATTAIRTRAGCTDHNCGAGAVSEPAAGADAAAVFSIDSRPWSSPVVTSFVCRRPGSGEGSTSATAKPGSDVREATSTSATKRYPLLGTVSTIHNNVEGSSTGATGTKVD
jgi:hypothetical protein